MKRIWGGWILSLMCLCLSAQTICEQKAQENVLRFLSSKKQGYEVKASTAKKSPLTRVYTAKKKGVVAYYVYNVSDGGFVVASGDEVAAEILCYSPSGTFDTTNISPNFQYWLNEYEQQISFARKIESRPYQNRKSTIGKVGVEPFIKTQWDQDFPYNIMCPTKKGGNPYYTGCVATAMAQVMKYYEWPGEGHGAHSYYDIYNGQLRAATFDGHQYDWNNMLFRYGDSATGIQNNAVAMLMSDCGIAVEMGYDNDGSAAWSENIPYALVQYFNYDKAVGQLYHDYCTDNVWSETIYDEVSHGRPVIFSGLTKNNAGHCFICDGYQAETDMYHFNWGWGGACDCYCLLSAVEGNGYNFKYAQDIIYGIQPPAEDTKPALSILAFDGNMDYTTSEESGYTSYSVVFTSNGEPNIIYNNTWRDVDVIFTMKYENTANGECAYAKALDLEFNKYSFRSIYPLQEDEEGYCNYYGEDNIVVRHVLVPQLTPGRYKITLAYKDYQDKDLDDESLWKDVETYMDCNNYQTVTIEPTGIASIAEWHGTQDNDAIFDLSGRKVANRQTKGTLPHGIYLMNQRKFVVK